MTKNYSDSSVDSGLPWWIWVLIVPVTIAIVVGTVISQLPEDPEEIYAECRAQLENGKPEECEATLAKLKEYPEYSHHVALIEGILAFARQREPISIQHLKVAAEHEALKSEALEIMGGSYARTGDYMKAVEAYKNASDADPNNINAMLKLAQFHYAIGGLTHAINLVEPLIEDGNRAARTLRASAYFDMEDYDRALQDYAVLLKTPGERAAASPDLIDRYVISALETDSQEHIEIGMNEFARMMSNKMLGAALYAAGGETDTAKRMISEMQQMSEYPGVAKVQADLAYRLGDFTQAENFILKTAPLYPRDRSTFKMAVKIFEETGNEERLKAATENLEQLNDLLQRFRTIVKEIDDNISDAQPRVDAVDVLIEMARPQDAIKWNQVAGIIDPSLELPSSVDVMVQAQGRKPLVPLAPDPPANRVRSTLEDAANADKVAADNDEPGDQTAQDKPAADNESADEASEVESDKAAKKDDAAADAPAKSAADAPAEESNESADESSDAPAEDDKPAEDGPGKSAAEADPSA